MSNYIPSRRRYEPQTKPKTLSDVLPIASLPAPISSELDEVVETFRKWLELPDAGSLEIMLAAYAANRLRGDPVWLFLVGGSSGGKGEVVNTITYLENTVPAATITESALLSGTPEEGRSKRATGGLLRQVGNFGILIFKDFTSVFTMNRDERGKALSALREIYDGRWDRPIGAEGGHTLTWQGKLGVVGGVTEAIDSEQAVMAKLGPRFVLYRLPPLSDEDAAKHAKKAIDGTEHANEMRRELAEAVRSFFATLDFEKPVEALSEIEIEYLTALAILSVRSRSHVERDSYKHEIIQIPQSEAPGRLTKALTQLWRGLAAIGVGAGRRRQLIRKVGLDGIPPIRRIALDYLSAHRDASVKDIANTCRYSQSTIRRALEDLACHHVVENQKAGTTDLWHLTESATRYFKTIGIEAPVSESPIVPFQTAGRVSILAEDRNVD